MVKMKMSEIECLLWNYDSYYLMGCSVGLAGEIF